MAKKQLSPAETAFFCTKTIITAVIITSSINGCSTAFLIVLSILPRFSLSAGISPEEALDNALLLIGDSRLSAQISDCRRRVLEGESFADAVCAANMFPAIYGRTLKIAYISGSFDKTWRKISERCSEQICLH